MKTTLKNYNEKAVITINEFTTSISGWRKSIIEPFLKTILKEGVNEDDSIRCAILFKTVSRVSSMMDVDKIFGYIRNMSREMCYYWYSKVIGYNEVKELREHILN